MAKFKVGDIITLKNNTGDPMANSPNKGIYKVTEVFSTGYSIYSLKLKHHKSFEELNEMLSGAQVDLARLEKVGKDTDFPHHAGRAKNVQELFDEGYRLATPAEVALYAPKI